MTSDTRKRRKHARVDTAPKLVARRADAGKEPVAVALINLSESGTAILATELLGEIDDQFLIELPRSRHERPLIFRCEICYVLGEQHSATYETTNWLHGARFAELAHESRSFIEEYVRERVSDSAALCT